MKFFSTLFYTIFIAILVGVAGLLVGTMLPIPGNIEIKIVKSGSMEPAIATGSIVVVKPQAIYRKGDIVTFGKDTKTDVPTTHRIIALNNDGTYTVKGDANEEQDANPVQKREVIGKVVLAVPYAGFVLDFARQPLGFALLIGVPAGLVILEEVLTIFNESKKWWRRRRRDDDFGSRTGGEDETLVMHLKRVHAKRRAMDEIKVAMYVHPKRFEKEWWVGKFGLHRDTYGTATMLTFGIIFMSSMFAGQSGGTIAYFQDIEKSIGNIFGAGERWALEAEEALLAQQEEELLLTPFAMMAEEGEVLGESVAPEEGEEGTAGEEEKKDDPAPVPAETSGGGGGGGGGSASEPEPETPEESAPPAESESPHNSTNEIITDLENPPGDVETPEGESSQAGHSSSPAGEVSDPASAPSASGLATGPQPHLTNETIPEPEPNPESLEQEPPSPPEEPSVPTAE